MGPITYLVLVQLMLFATGTALVALVALAIRKPKRWKSYAAVKVGILVTYGILLARVIVPLPEPTLPTDATTIGFTLGVAATGVGLVGVCRDLIRKAGRPAPAPPAGPLEVDEEGHPQ
jgi:hypothetical protein